jgi:hypothetical protein
VRDGRKRENLDSAELGAGKGLAAPFVRGSVVFSGGGIDGRQVILRAVQLRSIEKTGKHHKAITPPGGRRIS